MKKITGTLLAALLLILITGCNDEAEKMAKERNAKKEHMKQHVDTNGSKQITKLPF
jgi:hypothetical protein